MSTQHAITTIVPGAPGLVSVCKSYAKHGLAYNVSLERRKANSLAEKSWRNHPWTDADFQITIRAHRKDDPKRKSSKTKPPAISVGWPDQSQEQRVKGLKVALESLEHSRTMVKQWMKHDMVSGDFSYTRAYKADEHLARHRKVGKAIARIIARHKTRDPHRLTQADYLELDKACDCKVKRAGAVTDLELDRSGGSYFGYVVRLYCGSWHKWNKPRKNAPPVPDKRVNLGFVGCKPFYPPVPDYDQKHSARIAIQQFMNARIEVEYWQELVRLGGGDRLQPSSDDRLQQFLSDYHQEVTKP